jgi:hypothetical protein
LISVALCTRFMTRSSEKGKMKRKKMSPEEWRAEKARRDDLTRRLLAKIEELRKLTERRRAAGAE